MPGPGQRPLRVGVTGHIRLAPTALGPIYQALLGHLDRRAGRPVVGITCLADGTDQLFARAVLSRGGQVEVILPAPDYRTQIHQPDARDGFDDLMARARSVTYSGYPRSGASAYTAASLAMLGRSDELVAVWDGAGGTTAEVVAEARRRRIPTTIIWPPGATRTACADQ